MANIWGTLLNTNDLLIDGNLAGQVNLNCAGSSNIVLTFVNGSPSETTNLFYNCSGTLTGNVVVLFPAGMKKLFLVQNNCGGPYTLAFGVNNGSGAPAGSTLTVPEGATALLYSDGTNVIITSAGFFAPLNGVGTSGTWPISISGTAANISGTMAIGNGGTGATTAAGARNNLGLGSSAVLPALGSGTQVTTFTGPINNGHFVQLASDGTLIDSNTSASSFPSTTGGGATGTWNININGNAATATTAGTANALNAGNSYTVAGLAANGAITATGNITAFVSDMRLKDRLGGIANATKKLMSLDVFFFRLNKKARALGLDGKKRLGFSAQQVREVLPTAVVDAPLNGLLKRKMKNPYMTIDKDQILALLVATVQEQQHRIEALEKRLK